MERKYILQGFYRKNWRKNTCKEEAMLRLLVGRIEAEKLTVDFSGGAACLRSAVARQFLRLLRRRCAAVRWRRGSSLGARCVRGEESRREKEGMAV